MYYTVKVKIIPSDPKEPEVQYKSKIFVGEYVSKGKRTPKEKIEQQVIAYLQKNTVAQNPEMNFDIKVLKIEACNKRFIVVEDKV